MVCSVAIELAMLEKKIYGKGRKGIAMMSSCLLSRGEEWHVVVEISIAARVVFSISMIVRPLLAITSLPNYMCASSLLIGLV